MIITYNGRIIGGWVFANPGGALAPEDILGRDALVRRLWESLVSQSVVLTSERRIGKTCVIEKMTAYPPAGVTWLKRDIEGLRSAEEFVEALWQDVEPLLGRVDR